MLTANDEIIAKSWYENFKSKRDMRNKNVRRKDKARLRAIRNSTS